MTANDQQASADSQPELPADRVRIGSEEIPLNKPGSPELDGPAVKQVALRVSTLLKTDNVSFLLGAGCSLEAGGVSLANIARQLEAALLSKGITEGKVADWLQLFYSVVALLQPDFAAVKPLERQKLLGDKDQKDVPALSVNLERLLSLLYMWSSGLIGDSLEITRSGEKLTIRRAVLEALIGEVTAALVQACDLPRRGQEATLLVHRSLIKRVLTRPINLRRVNFFTLNYDTLLEQAFDAEGVVTIDGFVGSVSRVFRPESFNQDLYFPAQTTEGKVHRLDRVVQLCKLHGSITWRRADQTWDNPFGLTAQAGPAPADAVLVYPTPLKYEKSLAFPYSELFRKMSSSMVQPQSVAFVIGYGFGDEHVNSILMQALAIPSFTLVIVDPKPASSFVSRLLDQNDQRIWLITGKTVGTMSGFVRHLTPDMREEEILQKVMQTYNAMQAAQSSSRSEDVGEQ